MNLERDAAVLYVVQEAVVGLHEVLRSEVVRGAEPINHRRDLKFKVIERVSAKRCRFMVTKSVHSSRREDRSADMNFKKVLSSF